MLLPEPYLVTIPCAVVRPILTQVEIEKGESEEPSPKDKLLLSPQSTKSSTPSKDMDFKLLKDGAAAVPVKLVSGL